MKTPAPKTISKTRLTSRNRNNASIARSSALAPKANSTCKNLVELRGQEMIEDVASEKLEEIVESLVSAVVSTVEAENIKPIASKFSIELLKSQQCSANDRRFSEVEGKRKKDERDDSKKRLDHILLQTFAAPTNVNNPLEKHSKVSKNVTPAVMAKSQQMKNPTNGEQHYMQWSTARKSIDKPTSVLKSTKSLAKDVKDQAGFNKSSRPPTQPPQEKPQESANSKPAPQAPPRKRAQKELKKDDSKKSIESAGLDATRKSESQPATEEKACSGSSAQATTKTKADARQSNAGKTSTKGASEKAQETPSATSKVSGHGPTSVTKSKKK
ncbi:hypothetical protein OESDEN_06236 [Oesophagostomum dentatum]|uniref:Uncharacterized protein n=1 Tax=Oesophagostomum dentatum TaxID=61180 RepID=A0A0B1TCK1_OESDE|nr:hypothetical protein OESDEN_06236 [Oesophagostomum dentatum]